MTVLGWGLDLTHAYYVVTPKIKMTSIQSLAITLQQIENGQHVSLLVWQISLLVPWLFQVIGEWKMLLLNSEGHILYLFSWHISPMFLHGNLAKVIFFFFSFGSKLPISSLFHIPTKLFFQEDWHDKLGHLFLIFLQCWHLVCFLSTTTVLHPSQLILMRGERCIIVLMFENKVVFDFILFFCLLNWGTKAKSF